jgi:hypothetical protein
MLFPPYIAVSQSNSKRMFYHQHPVVQHLHKVLLHVGKTFAQPLISRSYIQMSGMILGGYLEADKRMINYLHRIRHHKRLARDMEVWRRYEENYEAKGTPGVGGESSVHGPDGKGS